MKHFGAVIYDEAERHAEGWACRAGESPRRIRSQGDLPTDTVWLTNLGFQPFRDSGLDRSPRFRRDDYLRLSGFTILSELGLKDATPPDQARALAGVFERVVGCGRALGLEGTPPTSLARGFREMILGRKSSFNAPADVMAVMQSATQPYVFCERTKPLDSDVHLTISSNRVEAALDMLSMPTPVGPWEFVPPSALPTDPTELLNFERPIFARVLVRRVRPEFAGVLNFGAGAGQIRRKGAAQTSLNSHEWVPLPELVLLMAHAEVEIKDVLMGHAFEPSPVRIPSVPSIGYASYSLGITLENIWTALTRDAEGRAEVSPRAAWMHALDRVQTLLLLLHLHERDESIQMIGYGYGRVSFRIQDPGMPLGKHLADILEGTSYVPPLMRDRAYKEAPLPEDLDGRKLLQVTMIRGNYDVISEIDRRTLLMLNAAAERADQAPAAERAA